MGAAADFGATLVAFVFLFAFSLLGSLVSAIATGSAPRPAVFMQSEAFLGISVLVASLASVLGGYIAGRLHPARPGAVGLLVGLISCLSALGLAALVREASPIQTSEVIALGLAVLGSVAGAFLGSKHPAPFRGYA